MYTCMYMFLTFKKARIWTHLDCHGFLVWFKLTSCESQKKRANYQGQNKGRLIILSTSDNERNTDIERIKEQKRAITFIFGIWENERKSIEN